MTQTTTLIDEALKDFYLPPAIEQLNNKTMMLAQIERNSRHVEGRNAVFPIHTERNSGIGARSENAQLPTAGNQSYEEVRVGMAHNYLRISVTGQAMYATKTDAGAFVRALEDEMSKGTNDLRRDVNRQVFNNTNDTIAQCATTTSSTTVNIATDTGKSALRQLEVGMLIDIGTTGSPATIASGVEITAIDRTVGSATITISGSAVTTSSSHYITRTGNAGEELIGLREIVATSGTLHSVTTAQYDGWVAYENANGGTNRLPSDDLFEEVIDNIDDIADSAPNFLVSSKGVRRAYASTLKAQKRFDSGSQLTLKGGFKALSVDCGDVSLPFVGERDCPNHTAFVLNLDNLTQHEMSDWEWMDKDGSILHRPDDYDRYQATLFKYHQLCTNRRNAHGIVVDLTDGDGGS